MDADFSALAIAQLWQVTALIVIVAVINRWLSRKRPHLAHVLWLVVLAKCLTPPLWSSTGGIFCWLQPEEVLKPSVAQLDIEWQAVEWQELLVTDSAANGWEPADNAPFAGVPLTDSEAAELLESVPLDVDWPSVLAASWLTSVSVVLFVVAVRWWLFWRRLKRTPRRECPELDEQLSELARQLGVRRVRLLVTESRIGPAVVGLFRKTILLPAVVVDRLASRSQVSPKPGDAQSPAELPRGNFVRRSKACSHELRVSEKLAYESLLPILAHELLHVRRGDLWVGLLQTLAQAVWWFHPLVWWVGRLTNREAERCCDEEVLAELKCDPAAYARSLLDVLELKSQLAPVPVFPGVRPVDVTSKRLERIMTLGQGCRRRTPWWCWLIAIGTAALTLPGAAFVVSAQDEAQPAEASSDVGPAPLPAAQADGALRPVPVGSDADRELRAYQKVNRDSTITTVVYETTGFAHLLSGTQIEEQQKFERLVCSRDQARDAEIKWFNDKPVVRTSNTGHQAVQDCLSFLAETNVTPKQFDAFLDSVEKHRETTLAIDLQIVTIGENLMRDVEAAALAAAETGSGSEQWTLPTEKWDAILENAKQASIGKLVGDGVTAISNPRLQVTNGRSVQIECVAAHPLPAPEPDGQKLSREPLIETSRWTGWKGKVLPCVLEDDSLWLGMKFQTGSVSRDEELPGFNHREIKFRTTLQRDQVVVLPKFAISQGDGPPQPAIVVVRIQKSDTASKSMAIPGDNQNISSVREAHAPEPTSADGRQVIQLGDFHVAIVPATDAGLRSVEEPSGTQRFRERVTFLLSQPKRQAPIGPQPRMFVSGDQSSLRRVDNNLILELTSNAHLCAGDCSIGGRVASVNADAVRLTVPLKHSSDGIRCEMSNAIVSFQRSQDLAAMSRGEDPEASVLRAGSIDLTLDRESMKVTDVSASKVGSLQPAGTPSGDMPAGITPVNLPVGNRIGNAWDRLSAEPSLRHLVTLKADDMPLIDVVRELKTLTGLQFVIDSVELEQAGLTWKTPVSVQLENVWLAEALRHILEPLRLGILINDHGFVQVTSARQMGGRLIAAVYPVADLVVPMPQRVVVHAEQESGSKAWKLLDPKEGVVPAAAEASSKSVFDFDDLTELIQSTIEPDSWVANGGQGRIEANETTLSLVIRQTQPVHEEISDLLGQLRRLRDLQVTLQIQTLEVPQSFLAEWDVDLAFQPLGQSKTQRFMRLSREQAEQLWQGSDVTQSPKVTLFNGQSCQWKLGGSDSGQPMLELQAVVSNDRRFVRLGVNQNDADTNGTGADSTAVISPVPDGDAVLLELNSLGSSGAPFIGVPVPGQPKVFRSVPNQRRFVLIQPQIVIVEEEEELLGVGP